MGEDGISKRCLFKHIGAAGTYCSLPGRELSSGQFDVNLSEKLKLTSVSGKEQLGGLLGGRQILESKGLEYYTKLFRKRSLPAVYLPFLVEDEKEFSDWLAESIFKKRVYGFSVTMPLKLNVANLSNSRVQSANLWNGRKQIFNTDLRAMRLILKDKELTGINHRTLIIGSGASSITAIKALNGRGEISISSRNFPRACQLSREYGLQYIIPENLKGKYFDLLINTTPLGMNNENLLDFVPGVEFAAAIDLPYRKGMTPLGRYCMKNGLLYVSGGEFWHYQAIEQEHYFLSVIKRRLANG
jgi:shikimate 5-dehydrogenase